MGNNRGLDLASKSGAVLRMDRKVLAKLRAFVSKEISNKSGQLNIFDQKNQGDVFKIMAEESDKKDMECLLQINDILYFLSSENVEVLRVLQDESGAEIKKKSETIPGVTEAGRP